MSLFRFAMNLDIFMRGTCVTMILFMCFVVVFSILFGPSCMNRIGEEMIS